MRLKNLCTYTDWAVPELLVEEVLQPQADECLRKRHMQHIWLKIIFLVIVVCF